MGDEEEEHLSICGWTDYSTKRCKTVISNGIFCKKHRLLVECYEYIPQSTSDDDTKPRCSTHKVVRLIPRSKDHLLSVLQRLRYEVTSVDVATSARDELLDEGDITEDDYIEVLDGTRYYYAKTTGQKRTSALRVVLDQFCWKDAVVAIGEEKAMYCEDCYKTLSKRYGHPTLNTIRKALKPPTPPVTPAADIPPTVDTASEE